MKFLREIFSDANGKASYKRVLGGLAALLIATLTIHSMSKGVEVNATVFYSLIGLATGMSGASLLERKNK